MVRFRVAFLLTLVVGMAASGCMSDGSPPEREAATSDPATAVDEGTEQERAMPSRALLDPWANATERVIFEGSVPASPCPMAPDSFQDAPEVGGHLAATSPAPCRGHALDAIQEGVRIPIGTASVMVELTPSANPAAASYRPTLVSYRGVPHEGDAQETEYRWTLPLGAVIAAEQEWNLPDHGESGYTLRIEVQPAGAADQEAMVQVRLVAQRQTDWAPLEVPAGPPPVPGYPAGVTVLADRALTVEGTVPEASDAPSGTFAIRPVPMGTAFLAVILSWDEPEGCRDEVWCRPTLRIGHEWDRWDSLRHTPERSGERYAVYRLPAGTLGSVVWSELAADESLLRGEAHRYTCMPREGPTPCAHVLPHVNLAEFRVDTFVTVEAWPVEPDLDEINRRHRLDERFGGSQPAGPHAP